MTARQSSPSDAPSDSNVRKRVCKACDRCRLKKSKCDGANPCGRCRADNAICVFGERKKAHDKVYPKGYVEMLEQQQAWLVHALQELYRRSRDGHGWPGKPLKCESNGHPLTHDLLSRLGALDQSRGDCFEENPDAMQQRLWSQNSGQMQRQDSTDASSDGGAQSPVITSFAQQLPPTPPSSFSPARAVQS
ncbi:C6 transcription factor, partial [Aspergillus sp. HF37]